MAFYIPIIIIVTSNILYHICAKSIPSQMNSMVTLLITYFVAGSLTLVLFFTMPYFLPVDKRIDATLFEQIKLTNWAPFVLGIVIVGLELGNILMYRAGWNISLGSLVSNISLAVLLILVGIFFYKEHINFNQSIGIILCIFGLFFINK